MRKFEEKSMQKPFYHVQLQQITLLIWQSFQMEQKRFKFYFGNQPADNLLNFAINLKLIISTLNQNGTLQLTFASSLGII